jgi:YVTN family beta-propeller protein
MLSFRLAPSLLMLIAGAGLALAKPKDKRPPACAPAAAQGAPAKVEIAPMPAQPPMTAGSPVAGVTPVAGQPVARWSATFLMHAEAGKQPTSCALMDDGQTLVVSNRGDNSVSIFDTDRLVLKKTIGQVGYSAWGVQPTAAGLLVANWNGSTVTLMDMVTGARKVEIPAGMKPSYMALSVDGKRVYTAGSFGGELVIADIATQHEVRRLDIGRHPMGLVASPDGRWLYVACCESKLIARVDLNHEVVLDRFGCDLASTTNLVLTPDGRTLVAAGEGGRILLVDAETGAVDKINVGADCSSVALTPDGRTALVTDYGNDTVVLVDLVQREAYDRVTTGDGPLHVVTDGRRFYTCNDKAGTVTAFRLDSLDAAAPVAGQ